MSLRLRLRPGASPPGLPIDAPILSPDLLAGASPAEAARRAASAGRDEVPLGDLFAIDEDRGAAAGTLTIEGDLAAFSRIGAGMSRGLVVVRGRAGPRAGSGMSGGRLAIDGDAGARAGEGMTGGALIVGGAAGDRLGAPVAGGARGVDGGVVVVRGAAGALAAFRMRRGTVVVGGLAGPAAGAAMIAGTLVLLQAPAADTGALMRRGTIVVMGRFAPGASFAPAGRAPAPWLKPWWDALVPAGVPLPAGLAGARFARYSGDLAEGGRGEILVLEESR